jgi:D-alanine--poly(phosphoribitol) ligase subunit 1
MKFSFEYKRFIDINEQPLKMAIIGENRSLTWLEFKDEVESFSSYLNENGYCNMKNPVMIYGHKQAEMIVAIYTCIALEIPYVPIDETYPSQRIQSIVEIASVELVINCSGKVFPIEDLTEIKLNQKNISINNPRKPQKYENAPVDPIVYIIFTSGSTGKPKGVQITRESIVDFLAWMTTDFGFCSEDVFINVAIFSFDLSVFELMTFSSLGSTILLNGKTTIENPDLFLERISKYKGNIWVSTPSFSLQFSRMHNDVISKNVNYFLFCGEVLTNQLAKSLKTHFPEVKLYNTYGPTEATVATTLIEITPEIIERYNPLPIGFTKKGTRIDIDNEEIVIVGKNVSIGYLNRPDLNSEKFIRIENERAFRTGDIGYFSDGLLFCKGRNDDQVKLHGYRIELNEITSKIDEIPFVFKSATLALKRNDEVKKIVSLVQLKSKVDFNVKNQIVDILSQNLPHYMIPSDIKVINEIPLNQNGKADKNRLLEIYLNE